MVKSNFRNGTYPMHIPVLSSGLAHSYIMSSSWIWRTFYMLLILTGYNSRHCVVSHCRTKYPHDLHVTVHQIRSNHVIVHVQMNCILSVSICVSKINLFLYNVKGYNYEKCHLLLATDSWSILSMILEMRARKYSWALFCSPLFIFISILIIV